MIWVTEPGPLVSCNCHCYDYGSDKTVMTGRYNQSLYFADF